MQKRNRPINRWLLPLAVLLVGTGVLGQESQWETNGLLNGRFWTDSNDLQKLVYMSGFQDALSQFAGDTSHDAYLAKGFNFMDYTKELNKLYADRENILIPVPWAIQYCTAKFRGDLTSTQLEQLLINVRRTVLALEEPKKR